MEITSLDTEDAITANAQFSLKKVAERLAALEAAKSAPKNAFSMDAVLKQLRNNFDTRKCKTGQEQDDEDTIEEDDSAITIDFGASHNSEASQPASQEDKIDAAKDTSSEVATQSQAQPPADDTTINTP